MHRLIVVGAVVWAIALGSPAGAEILIGAAGSRTGPDAWIGEQMERATELAVDDINAEGGVLGQQVRLVMADDYCDPEQGVVAAQKLVSDGVVFVMGHSCSGTSIPASKVYEAAGVLQISGASTNPLLTDQGRANVFRVIGRDDTQGIIAGNYLADHWANKKIAILHDNTTGGKGLAEETKRQLNKRGVTETIYDAYVPGKNDYSAEIARLQAAGIAVVYLGGLPSEPALMAREARVRNYLVQFVSGDMMASGEFPFIAGPAAEGTLFTFNADPRRNIEAAPVVKRFRATNFEPSGYTLFFYAAVQVWAQAVKKAHSLELQDVITALHRHQFNTVLGRIGFDAKGDITTSSWNWYIWKGGEYVPLD
jgi:branched-chain amino acid transport system substrate-binding protein